MSERNFEYAPRVDGDDTAPRALQPIDDIMDRVPGGFIAIGDVNGSDHRVIEGNNECEVQPVPTMTGPNDPRRMHLTREETQWALDIKYVIERLPEVDNLSDFWYAQLAIICKDNVEDAVRRAIGMQAYRQEYHILESPEDGSRRLSDYVRLLPEMFLAFNFVNDKDGSYVLVIDFNKADFSSVASSVEGTNAFFAGTYYLQHALLPDMASIRNGYVTVAECQDVGWSKKHDFKLLHKISIELLAVYPYTAVAKHYHVGAIMNVLLSLIRRVLPVGLKDKLQTGYSCHARLDTLCLVPTVEAATERVILRMSESIKRRYENVKAFTLVDL